MEKKLKDYLHLYLGCDAVIGDNPESKAGMLIDKIVGVYEVGATVSNGYIEDFKNIKPILRPLSDMTEEEAKQAWKLSSIGSYRFTGFDGPSRTIFYKNGNGNNGHEVLNKPEQFRYLLSKHFDLFGLIEAGLAIELQGERQKIN